MYIEKKILKKYISYWLATMFLIVSIMIIVGGLTRLTDSGLSITEWELFSGFLPPLNEAQWNIYFNLYKEIPEYKLQNYLMSLDEFKVIFWWEFIHRFLGRLIGIFFIIPLIYFSIKLGFNKSKNLFIIFFLICLQGFVGWYMVASGLVDRIDVSHYRLSLHLVLAFIILSLIFWNYLKYKEINPSEKKINFSLAILFLLLVFLQIAIGAFVSGMDAGKVYNSWPLMGSSYFPNDSSIGDLVNLEVFNEPSLVQFIHRNLAYLIFIFYLLILFVVYKNNIESLYKATKIIGSILIVQIVLGILTLLSGAQMIVSSMHQISSIFLVSSSIYFVYLNLNTNLQLSD